MTEIKNFDNVALNWDEAPRRVKLAGEIVSAIKAVITFSSEWDGLDVGCGTGLVTLQLAPLLHSITGIDSSCGMLDRLDAKLQSSGLTNVRTALRDIAAGDKPAGTFDLITSAMMLHHIKEIQPLLLTLKENLRPGGWIALADLVAEDGSFHEDPTGVFHHGFDGKELTILMESCGYSSISVTTATTISKGEKRYPVLLITAQSY